MIERICGKGEFCLLTSEGKSLLKKHWRFKRNTKAALAFFSIHLQTNKNTQKYSYNTTPYKITKLEIENYVFIYLYVVNCFFQLTCVYMHFLCVYLSH